MPSHHKVRLGRVGSLGTTAVALLPSAWDLGRRPTLPRLLYALFNISLTFFLFSFQVHEKSILLATVPAALLILDHPDVAAWFISIATFRSARGAASRRPSTRVSPALCACVCVSMQHVPAAEARWPGAGLRRNHAGMVAGLALAAPPACQPADACLAPASRDRRHVGPCG